MSVKPIPEGYNTITAYLVLDNASEAIEFYKKAFGAEELSRMPMPDGRVMHAEIKVGDSVIMMCDDMPDLGGTVHSPNKLGGSSISLMLYNTDTDAAYKKAVSAGAKELMPPDNMFWGDRFARVSDPWGHEWQLATHIEDVPPEEMHKRSQAAFTK